MLDSHPSHGSHSNPTCGGSRETKSKRLILCPILWDAPPRRSRILILVIGLALSRYRSVRISKKSLRSGQVVFPWFEPISMGYHRLPRVGSGLRKEHRPSTLIKKSPLVKPKCPYWKLKRLIFKKFFSNLSPLLIWYKTSLLTNKAILIAFFLKVKFLASYFRKIAALALNKEHRKSRLLYFSTNLQLSLLSETPFISLPY